MPKLNPSAQKNKIIVHKGRSWTIIYVCIMNIVGLYEVHKAKCKKTCKKTKKIKSKKAKSATNH